MNAARPPWWHLQWYAAWFVLATAALPYFGWPAVVYCAWGAVGVWVIDALDRVLLVLTRRLRVVS